mgnify:CR=1 FL=1
MLETGSYDAYVNQSLAEKFQDMLEEQIDWEELEEELEKDEAGLAYLGKFNDLNPSGKKKIDNRSKEEKKQDHIWMEVLRQVAEYMIDRPVKVEFGFTNSNNLIIKQQ